MRTGGEELGDTSGVKTSLSKTEGCTETSTTGTNDESIVGVVDNGILGGDGVLYVVRHDLGQRILRGRPKEGREEKKVRNISTMQRDHC